MEDSDNESGGHNNSWGAGNGDLTSPREQDRLLPIANVSRIMKKALPGNAKISKEAKETVQECVSEYISFITGEASDKCRREKRKTVNSEDLLWAMITLGFEDYIEPLKLYLHKFRELEGDRSASAATAQSQHRDSYEDVRGFSGAGMVMTGQHMLGTSPSPIYNPHMTTGGGNSSSSAGVRKH